MPYRICKTFEIEKLNVSSLPSAGAAATETEKSDYFGGEATESTTTVVLEEKEKPHSGETETQSSEATPSSGESSAQGGEPDDADAAEGDDAEDKASEDSTESSAEEERDSTGQSAGGGSDKRQSESESGRNRRQGQKQGERRENPPRDRVITVVESKAIKAWAGRCDFSGIGVHHGRGAGLRRICVWPTLGDTRVVVPNL
jgi:hypothetical protein